MLSDCLELYRTLKHIYVGLIRFHSNLIDFFSLYWICFEKNHPWEMVKTVSAFLFCLVRLTSWKQIGKHLFFSSRSVKEYLAPREPHFQNDSQHMLVGLCICWGFLSLHVGVDPVNKVWGLCVHSWVAGLRAPDHFLCILSNLFCVWAKNFRFP